MPGCEFGQVYQGSSPEVYGFERSRNDLAFQTYIPTFRAVILVYMSAMGGCVSSNAEQEGNPDLQRRAAVTGWSDRKGIPENATRVEYTDYEQLKNVLSRLLLFRNLGNQIMEQILHEVYVLPAQAGDVLLAPGLSDTNTRLYIGRTGGFEILEQRRGLTMRVNAHLHWPLGELGLLHDHPRSCSVVATREGSSVWVLERRAFRRVVQEAMEEERWRLRRAVEGLRLPATLGPRERGPLVDLFTEQTVTAGEVLWQPGGGMAGALFYIRDGEVQEEACGLAGSSSRVGPQDVDSGTGKGGGGGGGGGGTDGDDDGDGGGGDEEPGSAGCRAAGRRLSHGQVLAVGTLYGSCGVGGGGGDSSGRGGVTGSSCGGGDGRGGGCGGGSTAAWVAVTDVIALVLHADALAGPVAHFSSGKAAAGGAVGTAGVAAVHESTEGGRAGALVGVTDVSDVRLVDL